MPTLNLRLIAAIGVVVFALRKLWKFWRSPFRLIPGPPLGGYIFGNFKRIQTTEPGVLHEQWRKEFGHIYQYDGPLRVPRLCIFDKRALTHILITEPLSYPKPEPIRQAMARVFGCGVLFAEGDEHSKQRKIMSPSFGSANVRTLTPVFLENARKLLQLIEKKISESDDEEGPIVNMLNLLNRTSLDAIGSAGFGYDINSLDESKSNEMATAFMTMFDASQAPTPLQVASFIFPILGTLPDKSRVAVARDKSIKLMKQLGERLLADKKQNVLTEAGTDAKGIEKHQVVGKDLMSLLVKANMAADLKDSQKLTDAEVLAQISTFLIAGTDTTSLAVSWALSALCQNPTIQATLREEFRSASFSNAPSMEDLHSLTYLDAVVRETLRVYPPIPGVARVADKDDIIPLSKPWVDLNGKVHAELRVEKGMFIYIPILPLNVDEDIWGPDAHEFRPERWLEPNLPEGVQGLPSIHSISFLAGSRACIGYRFALTDMKAIIYTIVRDLSFEWVEGLDIAKGPGLVTRPMVKPRPEEGHQMPLRVRLVRD